MHLLLLGFALAPRHEVGGDYDQDEEDESERPHSTSAGATRCKWFDRRDLTMRRLDWLRTAVAPLVAVALRALAERGGGSPESWVARLAAIFLLLELQGDQLVIGAA